MPRPFADYGNLPTPDLPTYVAQLQRRLQIIDANVNALFAANGALVPPAGLNMNGSDVTDAGTITCTTLDCTNFVPPLSGAFLPLAGGAMAGPIAMGGANITNVGTLSGATNSFTADSIVSNTSTTVTGHIPTFTGAANVIQDSGVALTSLATTSALAAYLPLAGGTMTGSVAMGANGLTNVGTLSGATNSRSADNIVSTASTGTSGHLATFTGAAKVIQDSGTTLASLATTAALAAYLPLSGATMTGNIVMAGANITGIATLSGSTNSRNADNIVSTASTGVIGNIATFTGSAKVIQDSGTSLSSLASRQYSAYANTTVTGTTAETSLASGTATGSLTLASGLASGATITIRLILAATTVLADTLTIRIKTQAGTLITRNLAVVLGATGQLTTLTATLVVLPSSLSCLSILTQAGIVPIAQVDTPTFNPAITNTLSITGQWGQTASSCTISQLIVSTQA